MTANTALKSISLAGALLIACAALCLMLPRHQQAANEDDVGAPFTLVSDTGARITDQSFPGKYKLIYFGYTQCADICPITLSTLVAALNRLGTKAALVQPLFITLDPARDTPTALHHYVTAFTPRLIGLTGPPAALNRLADAFHVTSLLHQQPATYTLDHSSVLYLMAPDGHFIAPIPAGASESVMAQAIARNT